jgi:hypothetical protein
MEQFEKILTLENEMEAQILDSILNERAIPHRLRSYHDSAYDGLYQAQRGWGAVMAPPAFNEEITAIYRDLPLNSQDFSRSPE